MTGCTRSTSLPSGGGSQKLSGRRPFRNGQDVGLRRTAAPWIPGDPGDRDLAYQGDPETGEPTDGFLHEHHIWPVHEVEALIADQEQPVTFLCGGSRNSSKFIGLFDAVFVLEVDLDTLHRRLDARPDEEWGGGRPVDRERIVQWHASKEDVPTSGVVIDATAPVARVVDEILAHVAEPSGPVEPRRPVD